MKDFIEYIPRILVDISKETQFMKILPECALDPKNIDYQIPEEMPDHMFVLSRELNDGNKNYLLRMLSSDEVCRDFISFFPDKEEIEALNEINLTEVPKTKTTEDLFFYYVST
ncbi:MAG: hypothetical protein MJ252_11650 [archaeon]|nr:hypothetical protein [archaeon]